MIRFVVLAVSLGLGACGANSYCLVQQDYEKAEMVPELKGVDGLVMPNSPSALRLPPPPTDPVPFGREAEDGSGVCLDKPPRLAIPADSSPAPIAPPAKS